MHAVHVRTKAKETTDVLLFFTRKCIFGVLSCGILQEITNLRGHMVMMVNSELISFPDIKSLITAEISMYHACSVWIM